MGSGELTGNQSVHWRIDHQNGNKPKVNQGNPNRPKGDDEVNVDSIVQGRDPKKATHVDVRMRFKDEAEWQTALTGVKQETIDDNWYVTIRVPLLTRKAPDDPPPADVRLEWNGGSRSISS
jgi:hypothetical protein